MPHVNHTRGETGPFVFRREHGRRTHATWNKGKRNSHKEWKRRGNRIYRAHVRSWMYRVNAFDAWWDEMPPIDHEVRDLRDLS
jgi:hypothetical protein